MEDGDASPLCDRHVLVRAPGLAGQPQHRIAVLQQPLSRGLHLRRDGRIVAKELAAKLGLSEDSVRRDLRELDAAGLAVRVYGGALPASPAVVDHAARMSVPPESRRRVAAAAAAAIVEPGSTVILDGGTTTLAIVDALPKTFQGTIITHSPTIAAALLGHEAGVFLMGGQVFKHSAVACGATALRSAR